MGHSQTQPPHFISKNLPVAPPSAPILFVPTLTLQLRKSGGERLFLWDILAFCWKLANILKKGVRELSGLDEQTNIIDRWADR